MRTACTALIEPYLFKNKTDMLLIFLGKPFLIFVTCAKYYYFVYLTHRCEFVNYITQSVFQYDVIIQIFEEYK